MDDFLETSKKISYLTKKLKFIEEEYSNSIINDFEISFQFKEVVCNLNYMVYVLKKEYSGYGSLSPKYYVKHSFNNTDAAHIMDLQKKRTETHLDSYSKMMIDDFISTYKELKEVYVT